MPTPTRMLYVLLKKDNELDMDAAGDFTFVKNKLTKIKEGDFCPNPKTFEIFKEIKDAESYLESIGVKKVEYTKVLNSNKKANDELITGVKESLSVNEDNKDEDSTNVDSVDTSSKGKTTSDSNFRRPVTTSTSKENGESKKGLEIPKSEEPTLDDKDVANFLNQNRYVVAKNISTQKLNKADLKKLLSAAKIGRKRDLVINTLEQKLRKLEGSK